MNAKALLTDQYELTMAASYFQHRMFADATFSLFIREYPANRAYFVSAGLEDVLRYLESFRFEQKDLDYLDSTGLFSRDFLDYLGGVRFSGEVYALPEGRLFFKDEPILEVTAPIIEAQLVETFIINMLNLQVSLATKASRCVHAARKKTLVGRKQVYRSYKKEKIHRDVIALRKENQEGEALLAKVMEHGRKSRDPESLETIRERFEAEFEKLDNQHKALEKPVEFGPELGPELQKLQQEVIHEVKEKELGES